jgi:peptidase M28-like protein/PDZ domain-containing protein
MRKSIPLVFVSLVVVAAVWAADASSIDAASFLRHVKFLAADDLKGRGNGTPELDRAAEYIASRFREDRLEPRGDNASFFQPFDVVTGVDVKPGNRLVVSATGASADMAAGEDYYPLGVGGEVGDQPLPLVFAGYGISASGLKYDDYQGIDAAGKAALVFGHEPQENDAASVFEGRTNTVHASMMQKARVARSHGVKLLIVVDDYSHAVDGTNPKGWARAPQAEDYGVAVVRASRDKVQAAIGRAIDLSAVAADIDKTLQPQSRALDGVTVRYTERLDRIRRSVRNVIAELPGSDPALRDEAVVVGAHYDHLGLGGRDSLAEDAIGQIHNGADDNASGTAAMLEIARAAAANRSRFPRPVVFVAFAGEELGLLGSSYYVNHPAVPIERTVAMINLDMVGRPSGRILVSGLDSAPELDDDVKAAANGAAIEVKSFKGSASVGSSDDTSFLLRRVPSIGFFSGFHADYHRPSDDWEKIDAEGGAAVARLALALAERLSARREKAAFVAPANPHGGNAAASGGDSGGGYGPYFGSVPDFADEGNGVKFADVRENSPAARAGFRRGDVMISFGGAPIKTLYDFTFALRDRRPGDKVEVVVLREGKEVRAMVELSSRP